MISISVGIYLRWKSLQWNKKYVILTSHDAMNYHLSVYNYTMLFNINTFFINFEQFLENFNFYIQ